MSNNNSPRTSQPQSPAKKSDFKETPGEDVEDGMAARPFDIHAVINHFGASLVGAEDVDLPVYVSAYRELNKMFGVFGRLFSFVQKDVEDKERILTELHAANNASYQTVGKMIASECGDSSKPKELGCRTLLRLHRALEFIVHFVRRVHQSAHDDKMAHVCRAAYDETLGQHHPWYIRKGVHLAVYTLPTRKQLLIDLSGSTAEKFDEATADRTLVELIERAQPVYDRVQKMYADKGILNLP